MLPETFNGPVVGINIPWWSGGYSHDIGRNMRYPNWPVTYDRHTVSEIVKFLGKAKIRIVRLWLFEGGEGLRYDDSGWIQGIDDLFLQNLTELVCQLEEHGISVYWTIFDANSVYRNRDTITRFILTNEENAERFCNLVLLRVVPLLKKVAWAYDLCNEPEAMVRGLTGNWTSEGSSWATLLITFEIMRQFLKRIAPDTPISIGSGWHLCGNVRKGIYQEYFPELDFYDYHDQQIRPYAAGGLDVAVGAPIVLGELGIGGNPALAVSRGEWRAAQVLLQRKLACVMKSSYSAIFIWYLPHYGSRDIGGLIYDGEVSPVFHQIAEQNGGTISL